MARPKPPPVRKPIGLRLSPAEHARLKRIAGERGYGMATFTRMVLVEAMDVIEGKAKGKE